MSNNSKMTVSLRLGLGFGAVIALMLVLVVVGINRVGFIDNSLTEAQDVVALEMRQAIDFRGSVHDRAIALRDVALVRSSSERQAALEEIQALEEDYAEAERRLNDSLNARRDNASRDLELLSQIEEIQSNALPLMQDVIRLAEDDDREGAQDLLLGEAAPALADWLAAINALIDHQEEANQSLIAGANDAAEAFAVGMVIVFAVIALLAAIIAFLITRYFRRILGGEPHTTLEFIKSVEDGDLTARADTKFPDSILGNAISMRDSLREIITTLSEGVDTINTAAGEIATGNTDLSQRTEEQASNLEETAASMEEITSTVKQNADNARQGNSLARGARDAADKGGDIVDQVVTTMGQINESSKKVSDIISVIDGIAFQTNILALNAAVEAARAGEQGRGFAVVASEVRSLAQRSASAAKDIKELINESVQNVQSGSELVDRAGDSMQEILNSVKQVSDIMGEISAASDEQSTGIDEINQAVTQMDQVTQQNAALVEEAAAAAESLQSQSEELAGVVSDFKLSDKARAKRPAAASANTVRTSSAGQDAPQTQNNTSASQAQSARPATNTTPKNQSASRKPEPAPAKKRTEDDDDWEEF